MCRLFKVSRSSYYACIHQVGMGIRAQENTELSAQIKLIFFAHKCRYGSRRIRQSLLQQGYAISRRRVCRLMKAQALYCKTKRKFRMTTDSNHKSPIADNILNREFTQTEADKAYVGDITYIETQEGWLYLSTVIDLFSRKVVGWAMDGNMKAALVNDALQMAVQQRQPQTGLIWHTDRGSQYASQSHRNIIKSHGIIQSMSRKGNCWDNSVAESFFHTLKTELTHHERFETREQAKVAIFEYIETYYNRKRMHSANDYLSPVEFEAAHRVA